MISQVGLVKSYIGSVKSACLVGEIHESGCLNPPVGVVNPHIGLVKSQVWLVIPLVR